MATSVFDSFDDEDMPRPPLVRHPAFPAIVATWFATLLGLGTLVLPAVLLERLVGATGLSALLPAAAPPLGATARAMIAVAAALAGAAAGWAIARRVAGTQDIAEEPKRARYPSGLRRPINVRDELGDDVVIEDFGLPVPGQEAAISEDREWPDLGSEPFPPESHSDDAMESSGTRPHWPSAVESAVSDATEPVGHVDPGEPLAFTAPSLHRAEQSGESTAAACDGPREPAPLDGLGLVDLAERLRTSIERRREWTASTDAPAPPAAPVDLEAAPAEEAAQAMAAYFGRPTAIGGNAVPGMPPARRDGEAGIAAMASVSAASAQAAGADLGETDAALRRALANLQRVSGRA